MRKLSAACSAAPASSNSGRPELNWLSARASRRCWRRQPASSITSAPLQPAWAALSSQKLSALPVIPGVERLIILVDHDEAGLTAADTCMRRWIRAGRTVVRLKPQRAGADFNDLVGEPAT